MLCAPCGRAKLHPGHSSRRAAARCCRSSTGLEWHSTPWPRRTLSCVSAPAGVTGFRSARCALLAAGHILNPGHARARPVPCASQAAGRAGRAAAAEGRAPGVVRALRHRRGHPGGAVRSGRSGPSRGARRDQPLRPTVQARGHLRAVALGGQAQGLPSRGAGDPAGGGAGAGQAGARCRPGGPSPAAGRAQRRGRTGVIPRARPWRSPCSGVPGGLVGGRNPVHLVQSVARRAVQRCTRGSPRRDDRRSRPDTSAAVRGRDGVGPAASQCCLGHWRQPLVTSSSGRHAVSLAPASPGSRSRSRRRATSCPSSARRRAEEGQEALHPPVDRSPVDREPANPRSASHSATSASLSRKRAYQRTASAMTSSGSRCQEKALAERAVNRRPQAPQRHRWPPKRVCPSRLVTVLPHRTQAMGCLSSSASEARQCTCPLRGNRTCLVREVGPTAQPRDCGWWRGGAVRLRVHLAFPSVEQG